MCGIVCDSQPGPDLPVSCTQDSDCAFTTSTTRSSEGAKEQYCAQGVCRDHGACRSDSDCHNPSNILWNDKRCAGYLHCTEEGMCDRVCGEDCKNGSKAVQCFADPCSASCPEAKSCYASYCDGECRAEYFNAAGEVFDCGSEAVGGSKFAGDEPPKEVKPLKGDEPDSCSTSADCEAEETYCAGNGKCLPMGQCDNVEDCANRENSFMAIECVGETVCEVGLCGIICDTTPGNDIDINNLDSSAIGSPISLPAVLAAVFVAVVFV